MAKRLLFLNGLAIFGVVLNHASSLGFIAMFWWTDRYMPVSVPNFEQMGNLSYYTLRFIEQLIAFSVPAFLFVSGFYIAFATGFDERRVSWNVVAQRIKTLVIPYGIWSVVILAGDALLGVRHSAGEYLKILALGKAADPYYYVPLLFQLLFLSPILVPLAKRRWKLLIITTGVLHLFIQVMQYPFVLGVNSSDLRQLISFFPGWFFPRKMFWFTLGVVVCLHLEEFKPWVHRIKWYLLAFALILLPMGMIEWEALIRLSGQDWIGYFNTGLDSLYSIVFILCFFAFDQTKVPYINKIADIGSRSYGIYLVHSLVLIYLARAIYHLAPLILTSQTIFQSLLVLGGLGGPLLLMALIRNSQGRQVYKFLFG